MEELPDDSSKVLKDDEEALLAVSAESLAKNWKRFCQDSYIIRN